MRKKSQEVGSSVVTQHVFIFDLEGFSLAVRNTFKGTYIHTQKLYFCFIIYRLQPTLTP